MLEIILAISLITSPDSVTIRNTQNISYRVFMHPVRKIPLHDSLEVIVKNDTVSNGVNSNLYFQYKANKNWSAPKYIDEKVSECTLTVSSGDYVHIVWCKDGRVYYKTSIFPVRNNLRGVEKTTSFKENELFTKISNGASPLTQKDTIQWECNIAISIPELTEPASNISIYIKNDYIYVNWQTPLEGNPNEIEKWQRARWLGNTPFEWETPECLSKSH